MLRQNSTAETVIPPRLSKIIWAARTVPGLLPIYLTLPALSSDKIGLYLSCHLFSHCPVQWYIESRNQQHSVHQAPSDRKVSYLPTKQALKNLTTLIYLFPRYQVMEESIKINIHGSFCFIVSFV